MVEKDPTAFWRDLEDRFRALPDPTGDLHAIRHDLGWTICGGPKDDLQRERLQELFRSLAVRAAIAAGAPRGSNAVDYWLNLLQKETRYFRNGWVIRDLRSASAGYCTRAFELATAAQPSGVEPDRREKVYPTTIGRNIDKLRIECGWSFDNLATVMDLEKSTVLRHVNKGMGRPRTH